MADTPEVQGLDNLLENIEKIEKTKQAFADEALRRAQEYSPVRTGKLKNSWVSLVDDDEITIENTAMDDEGKPYAQYAEFGTVHDRGQYFLTRVVAEADQIWQVAKEKVGL